MAFGTVVPGLSLPVRPAVYGEILPVVIESSRLPARVGRMAGRAIGREICSLVVRVRGLVKIALVTPHAIGRCIGITPRCMAGCAILDVMTEG